MAITGGIKKNAFLFVILLGAVSLFADMTYEGARSITGPFLDILGAGASLIAIVAGLGEFIGYGLRLIFGYLSDRTKKYWTITIIGYTINLAAVPLLALAGRWEIAAVLVVAERLGKAIRTPARDAMLSYAVKKEKRGRGFGLHEALDQTGALLGPMIVAFVLLVKGSYRLSFALLAIPATLAIITLFLAKFLYPTPQQMETRTKKRTVNKFCKSFWLYIVAAGLIAAGFADYPLISYHLSHNSVMTPEWIPIFYSIAMGSDGIAALIFGYLYDRVGLSSLIIGSCVALLFSPFVFLGGFWSAFLGCVLWGIGMGLQEAVLRAGVADIIPSQKRATAYGIFNAGYGFCWFAGSAAMGLLYEKSITMLVTFSLLTQTMAVFLLLGLKKNWNN